MRRPKPSGEGKRWSEPKRGHQPKGSRPRHGWLVLHYPSLQLRTAPSAHGGQVLCERQIGPAHLARFRRVELGETETPGPELVVRAGQVDEQGRWLLASGRQVWP